MKSNMRYLSLTFLVLLCLVIPLNASATPIPYSIESGTNSMWIKSSLSAGVPQQVFINQSVGHTPDAENVFIFSDNFSSLNASKWSTYVNGSATATFSNGNLILSGPSGGTNWAVKKSINTFSPINKTIEFSAKESITDYQSMLGLATGNTSASLGGNYIGIQFQNNSSYSAVPKLYSSAAIVPLGSTALPNVQYKYTIKYIPGNTSVYANDTAILLNQAGIINAGNYYVYVTEVSPYNAANTLTVDWFRVRDALPIEPTVQFSKYSVINGINYSVYNITSTSTVQNYAINLSSVGATTETDSFDVETGLIPPVASFENNISGIGVGGSVQFTDTSTNNPTAWLWDFGDGVTSTQQNPVHTYTTLGTFTIKLLVTNPYGSSNITRAGLITTAYSGKIGDLSLTDIRCDTLSDTPNSIFASAKGNAVVCNVSVGYNSSLRCIDYTKTHDQLGEIYFTKFNPAVETNYSFDIGLNSSSQNNQFYLYTALSFVEIEKFTNGNYLVVSVWTADNGTTVTSSYTLQAADIQNNKIHISIENNDTTRYNTVTVDGHTLSTPYRLRLSRDLPYYTLVTPVLFGESYVSDVGGYLTTHIYSVTQTIRRNTVTVYGPDNYQAFGLDWQSATDAQNGSNYMLANKQIGTIWQDTAYLDSNHVEFTKTLLTEKWEPGIHFTHSFTTLSEGSAEAEIDANMTEYYNLYGAYPTSWCSLANADNVTQAIYVYNHYGSLWRNGNSGVTWITNVGNIENGTYPCFWANFITHGAPYPVFTHQTDWAVAPSSSAIDWEKFKTFSDGYKNKGVNIVGFAQYYKMGLSQKQATVTNIESGEGFLKLSVNSSGYPVKVNVATELLNPTVYLGSSPVETTDLNGGISFTADANNSYTLATDEYASKYILVHTDTQLGNTVVVILAIVISLTGMLFTIIALTLVVKMMNGSISVKTLENFIGASVCMVIMLGVAVCVIATAINLV